MPLLRFIEKLPAFPTLLVGAWMAFAPFTPEPHLVEKIRWLVEGHPFRTIDVFDLFMHGGLGLIGALKLYCVLGKKCGDAALPTTDNPDA